jgi:hypothetical protein
VRALLNVCLRAGIIYFAATVAHYPFFEYQPELFNNSPVYGMDSIFMRPAGVRAGSYAIKWRSGKGCVGSNSAASVFLYIKKKLMRQPDIALSAGGNTVPAAVAIIVPIVLFIANVIGFEFLLMKMERGNALVACMSCPTTNTECPSIRTSVAT